MSVNKYQVKTGVRYEVRLYVGKDANGKQQYHVKKGFKIEKEAKLYEARKKVEIAEKGFSKPSHQFFREVYKEWLLSYQNRVQETTFQRTQDLFRLHILPVLGDKEIAKVSPSDCQKIINQWGSKFANVKQLKSYTSQIFDYGIFAEILQRNPMKKTQLPKREKKESTNFFSLDELKQFMMILKEEESLKHLLIFQLLISTGVRKGELSALRWADIDFRNATLYISKSYATVRNNDESAKRKTLRIEKSTKTVSASRSLPIDLKTIDMLQQWKAEQAKELLRLGINSNRQQQLIFTYVTADGQVNQPLHADYANNIMKKLEKKHQFKHVTIHGLRHTHATLLLEGGASVKETQDRLGHKNAETTLNTYSHVTEKAKRNAVDKFVAYTNL
jgi:integrase